MARSVTASSTVMVLLFVSCISAVTSAGFGGGGRLGGRSEVKDVKNNKEVQELGRFAVQKYNMKPQNEIGTLTFLEVVKAESQVVAGTKYYLTISAKSTSPTTTPTAAPESADADPAAKVSGKKMFEAQVVVKPWIPSKQLLSFGPSPSS